MTDPQHPRSEPDMDPREPAPRDPETTGVDETLLTEEETPVGRRGWALLGTGLLMAIMVAAGLAAAITVTPGPDEQAMARPDGADVVVAADAAPLSWDPAAVADGASAQLLSAVYEGLTVLDGSSQVHPALAQSWALEEDGHRITFQLRDGLTFSDGSPIDAAAVRRSWLRVIDPERPSPLSSLLDDVVGATAYARGQGSVDEVGIHADGRALSVDFERPAAYFPAVAATPTLGVVPESIDEQARGPDGTRFVASGSFVPLDQELGQVRLSANEHYWAGRPTTERITVVTDIGGRSRVDVFEDGAVDWTTIASADAAWIRYDRQLGPQLRYAGQMAVDLLGMDATVPPFDDPAVRRALAMAVDWRRLAALDGTDVELPTSIVPPGIHGRGEGDYLLPHDPDAARAELASAGFPGGRGFPAVTLVTYGVGPAPAIAADLERELGIDVTVEQRGFAEHSALLDGDTPALWTLAWSADYPHAHDFLGLLLASGSSANLSGWSDPAFDALIDAAAATDDPVEQARLYDEAQVIVREQAPLIPMGYGETWSLSREGLRGAALSGTGLLRYAELAWAD